MAVAGLLALPLRAQVTPPRSPAPKAPLAKAPAGKARRANAAPAAPPTPAPTTPAPVAPDGIPPQDAFATAMNVAYAARQRGDTAAARQYFNRALSIDSARATPYIELGYLDLAAGNRTAAAAWFEKGAARAPQNADVRRQLAYVYVDLRRSADAIRAFESLTGTPGGYTDRDRLALAYLYDAVARNDDAMAAFRRAAQSADTGVANPARRALRVKGDVGTVWFSEGYLAPFYQTRFENAIGFGFLRHGIEGGSAWAPALYTSVRATRDSKSTAGAQSRVLSDNAAIVAGGVRLRPWHGPLWLYAEAGGAYSLLRGDTGAWRRDVRGGAYLIAQDERRVYPSAHWKIVTDVVADASWYERFDRNVIGYGLLREGVRVGTVGKAALDLFGRGWVGYDSRGEFYNRAAEGGGGMALRLGPNFVLFGEGLYGRFIQPPPAGVKRRYQDWRVTAVLGWRAVTSVRAEGAR